MLEDLDCQERQDAKENQDWEDCLDLREIQACLVREAPRERWASWDSLVNPEELDVMDSQVELDLRVIPAKMACLEDLDFLDWLDKKETQVFPDYRAQMAPLETMALLEKMVSLVHLVCLELKEKVDLLDWTDSQAYQVQRETLATVNQVRKGLKVTQDEMVCPVFKGRLDYLERTDCRDLMERREILVSLDCLDKKERQACLDSPELKVNPEEMV